MGLFSRQNQDDQPAAAARRTRSGTSSDNQARALRVKARRRLAGALALVLAAVVVLPMVLDSEPVPVARDIAVSIPEQIARPVVPPLVADASDALNTPPAPAESAPPAAPEAPLNLPPVTTPPPVAPAITEPPRVTPPRTPPPAAQTPATTTPPPTRPSTRSDDGAVALALLEGRSPASAAPTRAPAAQQGRFVLQVAAYTTEASAVARRNELHAAGITNAYVEPVTASGKRQFRLRVGPFPSRDAAQAAQARMRTLGYDNGFIAPQ